MVSAVDQVLPVAEEEVSTTPFPAQKVVGPPAEMVGTGGNGLTVTVVEAEVDEQPLAATVTE